MEKQALLPQSFYEIGTISVARRSLGKILVRETPAGPLSGRIVETEAYFCDDPASHAFRGQTLRNAAMFGPPGRAYVYFTYGNHFMLNLVTSSKSCAEAVLIRALEPLEGVEQMRLNRQVEDSVADIKLCAGPGRLAKALGITRTQFDHVDLTTTMGGLYVLDAPDIPAGDIVVTTRIGITRGAELPWRFYVRNSKAVSRR